MAIVLDATSTTKNLTNQTAGGTTTLSHTVGSGSNRLLIVPISAWNNGGTGTGCSGITYNGTAMTKIAVDSGSAGGQFYTEMWYLIAPATGTANIVATVAGKTDLLSVTGFSVTGADQTTPYDVAASVTNTTGFLTTSITTTAANDLMVDITSHLSANAASTHTNTQITNTGTGGVGVASQYGIAASAGSNSMQWFYPDAGDTGTYLLAAFKEAGGGGGGPSITGSILPYFQP